ncbi:MAG: septum site-determining protein MinC [Firmicutes bacterium]|nr:septum site-determining protein MinC [Bacillota bacterium]
MYREAVSIKGTKSGLVILLDSNHEFETIKHHLQHKIESANGFFCGAKVVFHTGSQQLVPQQQHELESICKQYGLVPSTSHLTPETETLFSPPRKEKTASAPGEPALLLKQTLRSGRSVSRPGHIIVLGNVHPGAKVEAGGNIIIMGNCLGTVHAGAHGNRNAIITALHMAPQVLSIAGITHIGTLAHKKAHGPGKAMIKNEKIVFTQNK